MEIKHDKNEGRFYVRGEKGDAELLYGIRNGIMYIYHTYVPEGERGEGLAEKLSDAAFSFAIKNNLKVKPACSYIEYYLSKHSEMKKYAV
ncbi:MAG: GNAT family N-acetyltransferase [Candidatus Micrarchaeaceae archaeon]